MNEWYQYDSECETDSNSGNSDFDEEYEKLKPPISITNDNSRSIQIIKIKKEEYPDEISSFNQSVEIQNISNEDKKVKIRTKKKSNIEIKVAKKNCTYNQFKENHKLSIEPNEVRKGKKKSKVEIQPYSSNVDYNLWQRVKTALNRVDWNKVPFGKDYMLLQQIQIAVKYGLPCTKSDCLICIRICSKYYKNYKLSLCGEFMVCLVLVLSIETFSYIKGGN